MDIPQATPFGGPIQAGPPPAKPAGISDTTWFNTQVLDMTRNGPSFGSRKDAFLPWLLVRSTPGDNGARPFAGTVWWESPDIYALANIDPATAPLIPDFSTGPLQVTAGAPNTLYAHVWNLGKAAAYRVRVEFHWLSPTMGITRADSHLIGAAWIDLGDRFTRYSNWTQVSGVSGNYASRGCHAIVKCPVPWIPDIKNGGHECLVVRAFEPILDGTPSDSYSALNDRHVAQHNLSVVQAQSPAQIDLPLSLGYTPNPGIVVVDYQRVAPADAPWIGLLGPWAPQLTPAVGPVLVGFTPPTTRAARTLPITALPPGSRPPLLQASETFERGCDPVQIQFHASADLQPNEGALLRVRQQQDGAIVGGYSVLLYRR